MVVQAKYDSMMRFSISIICLFGFIALFIAFIPKAAHATPPIEGREAIAAFYMDREGAPLWLDGGMLNRSGHELLGVLRQSWMNGLNPKQYYVTAIEALLKDRHYDSGLSDMQLLELEVMLTAGYVRYIRDLSGMRIEASDMGLDPDHWRQRISVTQALSYLPEESQRIAEFLLLREPQGTTYQRLKTELRHLVNSGFDPKKQRQNQAEALSFNQLVRPGYGYDGIPKLRARLGTEGVPKQDRYKYDPALVQAVKAYQKNSGLKADGIIGPKTLHVLNQTTQDKINQLIVNMERLRWVPDQKPDKFIVVNIPSATLWAIEDGRVQHEMPVIVGRKKRQTVPFVTQVNGVRFNPTWTVPPTIKKEDILPKLKEDPSYLLNKGMELYNGYGPEAMTLDPTAIDWDFVSTEELHGLRMVQTPGPHNPLGQFRIFMPNKHNIYLHDTNEKHLFSKADRTLSSGCVRMRHPEKIAHFIMKDVPDWSDEKMQAILQKGALRDIYVQNKVPVYLLYYTSWLGDNSVIVYGKDIYDRDKKLLQLIEKLDGFDIIRNTKTKVVQVVD